ncbi:MAG: LysR family transcriptional regulator [Polyangiaceae bacterium]|nr:LysR family transcriptional regulator [Polyangiaceae bacterium]
MAKSAHARGERLDWDLLRVFLGVARAGRLVAAADRLGLDVSTVSRRLDRLEHELGMALFERGAGGAILTAAGERLMPAAEEMEHAVGSLSAALDAVEAEAEGVVRLSAPPGVAECFVAPALSRFHADHPKVRLDLDASVGYADLTRHEADLALRLSRPERGDLVAQRLMDVRSVPAGKPAYVTELGPLNRANDARWIVWGHDLAHIPDARWLAKHAGAPPVLRTSSFSSQLAAAVGGLGLFLAPEPFLERFELAPVRPGRALKEAWAELPVAELWLVGHVALRRVPRVAALWEFLVREFRPA